MIDGFSVAVAFDCVHPANGHDTPRRENWCLVHCKMKYLLIDSKYVMGEFKCWNDRAK